MRSKFVANYPGGRWVGECQHRHQHHGNRRAQPRRQGGIIFDPNNGRWYYGTAGDGGITGTFGTVAFSGTTATLTQLLSGVAAHGLTFDPFTNDIINSGTEIEQFDPTWPANSGISVPQMGKAIYSARRTPET
jgi:hypothetical protein